MHRLPFLLVVLCAPALSQTNLRGWHADGQTWLVWEDDQTFQSNESYSIHASPNPIASLAGTFRIGRLLPPDWQAPRLKIVDPALTFTIPDGQGGTTTLAPDEALFVATPKAPTSLYFAVVKTGDTTVGPDNTVGPIAQTVDPVRPHLQHTGVDAGHDYSLYSVWIDGRADHTAGRPDFPVMGNATFNGTSQVFCVFEPTAPPAGPLPAFVFLHGSGGSWWKFRPSRGPSARLDLELEDALYVTLDEHASFWGGPQADEVVTQSGLWFGYRQDWDRFEDPLPAPPDDSLVVDYSHRRIGWILDWLVAERDVDEGAIGIGGLSAGAMGSSSFSRARPERIASTLLVVPPAAYPEPPIAAPWGTPEQNLPTTLPGGLGVMDSMLPYTPVSDADVPFQRAFNGTEDAKIGWEDVPGMYDELEALRWGAHLYWDERGHTPGDGSWDSAHWTGSPDIALSDMLRFRSDESFPAITGLDADPAPGRQPDPGDGVVPANGDPWGVWGGWVDWDPGTIVDRAGRWAVVLRRAQPSPNANDSVPPAVAFRVTIRRPQRWVSAPLRPFAWRLVDVATGATLQHGFGRSDVDGTTTVEGLVLDDTLALGARLEVVRVRPRLAQ